MYAFSSQAYTYQANHECLYYNYFVHDIRSGRYLQNQFDTIPSTFNLVSGGQTLFLTRAKGGFCARQEGGSGRARLPANLLRISCVVPMLNFESAKCRTKGLLTFFGCLLTLVLNSNTPIEECTCAADSSWH